MQTASSASRTGKRVAVGIAVGDHGRDVEVPAGAQERGARFRPDWQSEPYAQTLPSGCHEQAAVDRQDMTGDKGCAVRNEEGDCSGDVLRLIRIARAAFA